MQRLIIIANEVGNRKGCVSSDFFPICLIPDDASALVICDILCFYSRGAFDLYETKERAKVVDVCMLDLAPDLDGGVPGAQVWWCGMPHVRIQNI